MRDDDERVGREGEAEGAGRDLAHLTGEGREAALHLAVADEGRDETQACQPEDGRGPEQGAIAAGTVVVLRGRDRGAVVAQGPDEEGEGDEHAHGVEDEDRRERGWSVDRDEESADHTAQADPQVDQGEVDPEELLPGRSADDRGDEGVPGAPVHAPAHAHDEHCGEKPGQGRAEAHEQWRRDGQGGRGDDDPATADPVGQGTARAGDDEGSDGDQAHEHAGRVQADVPDLGEVDDREGQDHAPTQRGDGGRRQQPPA